MSEMILNNMFYINFMICYVHTISILRRVTSNPTTMVHNFSSWELSKKIICARLCLCHLIILLLLILYHKLLTVFVSCN